MPFVTKLAASVLLALGVTMLTIITLRPDNVAFADVVAKVAKAKALSFTATTPLPGTDKAVEQRFLILADGRSRVEDGKHRVTIVDAKRGLEVTLDAEAKTAHVLKNEQYGFPNDPLQSFKDLKDKDAKPLGEKKLGARAVVGFATKQGGADCVVWADKASGDPVRVEWTMPVWGGKTTMVMENFVIDPNVDEALLDTTPPKGYEVFEMTRRPTTGAATQATTTATVTADAAEEDRGEAHVIGLLRNYAGRHGGKFPPKLDDWDAYAKLAKRDQPTEDDVMLTIHAASMKLFLQTLKPGTWGYQGSAKFGDHDRVVFWYWDEASKKHLAVHGDLGVHDVRPDALPGAK